MINGHCLFISTHKQRFDLAERECRKKNAILFEPKDAITNQEVGKLLKGRSEDYYFIGIHSIGHSSDSKNVYDSTGKKLTWINPNKSLDSQQCLLLSPSNNGKWRDVGCTYPSYFICEITDL